MTIPVQPSLRPLWGLVLLGAAAHASPAAACDRLPISGLTFSVFPTDGALAVDPETMILVPQAIVDGGAPRLLRGPDFAAVDVVVDELQVAAEFGGTETVFRLKPTAPLDADVLYRVAGDVVADGVVDDTVRIGEFVVAAADDVIVDASALGAPVVASATQTIAVRDDSGFSCAFDGTAAIAVSGAPDHVLVIATAGDDDDDNEDDNTFLGLGVDDVTVFGNDAFVIDVAFMDGRGRRSEATTLRVNLTAAPGPNCAQGDDVFWVPMLAAVVGTLAVSRRRRRRVMATSAQMPGQAQV